MLPIQVLTRHEAGVNCLAVYGNLVFTGSEDKDIKVVGIPRKCQCCIKLVLGTYRLAA